MGRSESIPPSRRRLLASVRGRLCAVWGLQPLARLHLVHRPGDGTSGIRPVETCSILFCSDDHKGRGGSLGRKVARVSAKSEPKLSWRNPCRSYLDKRLTP